MRDNDEWRDGGSVRCDARNDGRVSCVLSDGVHGLVANEPVVDKDLFLLGVLVLVDSGFVHVEHKRSRNVLEKLLRVFHELPDLFVVEVEPARLDGGASMNIKTPRLSSAILRPFFVTRFPILTNTS